MELPVLPVWVNDFLGDVRTSTMTTEEVGAYFLLLLYAWQEQPPATLPNDDAILCQLTRMGTDRWLGCRDKVLSCFGQSRDGRRLVQKKLEKVYMEALEKKHSKSKAGKVGASKRWQTHSNRNAVALSTQCDSGVGEDVLEEKGVDGERETFPPEIPEPSTVALELAHQWCMALKRLKLGYPADKPKDIAHQIEELVRMGHKPESLRAAILDKSRDKAEFFWEFKKRLPKTWQGPPPESSEEIAAKSRAERERLAEKRRHADEQWEASGELPKRIGDA